MFTSLFLQVQVKSEVIVHESKSSLKSVRGETWSSLKSVRGETWSSLKSVRGYTWSSLKSVSVLAWSSLKSLVMSPSHVSSRYKIKNLMSLLVVMTVICCYLVY